MHKPQSSQPLASFIRRRHFLLLGSMFSVGALLPPSVKRLVLGKPAVAAKISHPGSNRYSHTATQNIGFLQDGKVLDFAQSDGLPELSRKSPDRRFEQNMIAASALRNSDSEFLSRGAQLRMHQLYVPPGSEQRLMASIHYRPEAVKDAIKVCVGCSAESLGGVPSYSDSHSMSLNVPVTRAHGLVLSLESIDASDQTSDAIARPAEFHIAPGNGAQLQRGTYVIAANSTAIDWSNYQLQSGVSDTPDGMQYLYRHDSRQGKLVLADFPYMLISIDYSNA